MYTRDFNPPKKSFFLFGPRGTGKSTFLRSQFPDAHFVDLLPASQFLKFEKNPALFSAEIQTLPKAKTIVVDEIQKAPSLLDEVHALIETHGYKNFILTGSSARKLKRGEANLLAGRAVTRSFLPLTSHETDFSVATPQILKNGLLPASVVAKTDGDREDFLRAYVLTYLQEEIKNEAAVRSIGSFGRFLEIATLAAGTTLNISSIARYAGIGRDTVRNYMSILEHTLIGSWLPAFRPRAKIKEVLSPKFYWFDSGVLNAAAGGFQQPLSATWNGTLFEHWVHHELRAYLDWSGKKGSLGYWATPSESEIDFVHWYGDQIVGIEAKATERFKPEFLKGFRAFETKTKLKSTWLVYLGQEELKVGTTRILPIYSFLKRLYSGEVI